MPATTYERGDGETVKSLGPGFKSNYAQVGDLRIHYVSGGNGAPLLLILGWPQTWYVWRHLMPLLAKTHHVIAVDTRGMNYSSRPTSAYDSKTCADDLHGLMTQLGHARFNVIGHDVGMWIAYALAADYPEKVERLAVMEAVLPGLGLNPPFFSSTIQDIKRWQFVFNPLPDLPEALIIGREAEYLTWLFENKAFRPDAIAMHEYIRAYSSPGAMRAGFAYYRALPETISQNELRAKTKLRMPVLALGGEFALGVMPQQVMETVADNVIGGEVKACGHYIPEECPDQLLTWLMPFLTAKV